MISTYTDVFDAMDAYPDDGPGSVGGDGQIRFLDWQRILQRSLGLEPRNWVRTWSAGGVRVTRPATPLLGAAAALIAPPPPATVAPGNVWLREVLLSAGSVEQVAVGHEANVPIYVKIGAGYSLGGLNFRVTVTPQYNSPSVDQQVTFVPARDVPLPVQGAGPTANVILCGWPLVPSPSFQPALQGTQLLGYIRFLVPVTATRGDCYLVDFSYADGSPDAETQYNFETLSGCARVESLVGADD